jgi:undecaprenyl-phosphate 4-deoxy-4-formamido-L-arabinose transferase
MENRVDISVLVPILNEEESLGELNERLGAVLSSTGRSYEIIYINDGSTDRTQEMIEGFRQADPRVKVIEFNRNYGQHMALFAGFERTAGKVIVTIDADLQNPPEEIPRLIEKADEDYDVVATYRRGRQDSVLRRWPSWIVNKITSRLVGAKLRDYGCMLRAYSRDVIDSINLCQESSSFIPALANTYARKFIEIEVGHVERKKGVSKYGLFRLLRLNFDLMTGFSLMPIQSISILGVVIALLGLIFALYLLVRRLIVGPESEGLFTLFAVLFFFVGIQIFALGIIGEYIGRIFQEVRRRPRFIVKKELL